ncbi:gametogenetin-binding protein 2 isoform X2 [Bacillus rossius redtenbacheri]|uniref:gametogenetin-binding protein 2 isoform X2 n=1 Tax=Bacillus rossius redtenbacheri TaxID=93214 RepID=UPI002FDE130C
MAKLVDVFQHEKQVTIGRRQLPVLIDETLTMVMDLTHMGLMCDNPTVRGKELENFQCKFTVLSPEELESAFMVTFPDLMHVLSQTVPCVGCRRSVERLLEQLAKSGHPTLDPLVVSCDGVVSINAEHLRNPQLMCTLLHNHSENLSRLVESQPRSKKSRRCLLHTLDSQRSRPSGDWRDLWDCMAVGCREEVLIIESATLLNRLNDYLRKHRFCGECRTKVMRAYTLLTEEPEPTREKGYVPGLYQGIRRCLHEKHLHVQRETEYIDDLITRAEPELMGRRERHAKTMETAQEEVLTCLGLCVYERLHKINNRLREEQSTCMMLAAVAVEAIARAFQVKVDLTRGVSQFELVCDEMCKEEIAKLQRKEYKKQRRRRRREKRVLEEQDVKENSCELQFLDRKANRTILCNCKDCLQRTENGSSSKRWVGTLEEKQDTKPLCGEEKRSDSGVNLVEDRDYGHADGCTDLSIESLSAICCTCDDDQETVLKADCLEGKKKSGSWCSSDQSHDCGYSSENTTGSCATQSELSSLASSREGSEVGCSDGFCNHEGDNISECHFSHSSSDGRLKITCKSQMLSLQEMLEESFSSDNGEEGCIPVEEVRAFKAKMCHVTEQRLKLRQQLRKRFDQLCSGKLPVPVHRLTTPCVSH